MIIHTVGFQWKPEATPAHQRQALEALRGFQGRIPGLLEVHAGANFSGHGKGYALAATMKFDSRDALQAYAAHPVHQALVAWLLPLVDLVEFDIDSEPASA